MEFFSQEYWSGLSVSSPGDLPNPGIEHRSPALQADSLPSESPGKPSYLLLCNQFSSVQLLSCVQLFATPWPAACQTSLSITNSLSLPKLMSIESVMPSNHLILCCLLLLLPSIFPSIRVFPMSQLFASGGQSIRASATVFPMNIQGWFPLGLTGLISLQLKELSRVFSNITVQKHHFFGAQLSSQSNSHIHT